MGSSSVNDEEIRQLEIALKKKSEQDLIYYKYLQEQDLKNLDREYEELKRANEQFKSHKFNRFNKFKSQNFENNSDSDSD